MGYKEASAFLDALGIDAMKKLAPSLHRMQALCEALDNPERAIQAIHITGTNGKTSTARIASSLIAALGLSVGTYTSPHLQSVRERICLNGEPISEEDFGAVFDHLFPFLETVEARTGERLSYFEVLTAMYFLWAAEAPVDVSVVEVGLGGTWDATNVIEAPVAVITNVGRDHTDLLGKDRASIAAEKVGIIKPSSLVVTAERTPDILSLIRRAADQNEAELSVLDDAFSLVDNRIALGGRYVSVKTSRRAYEGLFLPLHGSHQAVNAAVALESVTRFLPANGLGEEVVAEGFGRISVPGRVEMIRPAAEERAPVVLDVAHNPDGVSALVTSLVETFAFDRVVFVIGILEGKDHMGILRELTRVPAYLMVTEAQSERALPTAELTAAADELGLAYDSRRSVPQAVTAAIDLAASNELVCVTGSHYVVGEARTHLSA